MKTRSRKSTPRRTAAAPLPQPSELELRFPEPPCDDEEAEIRYSLTALGEAVVADRRGRFRGFGPCIAVA